MGSQFEPSLTDREVGNPGKGFLVTRMPPARLRARLNLHPEPAGRVLRPGLDAGVYVFSFVASAGRALGVGSF